MGYGPTSTPSEPLWHLSEMLGRIDERTATLVSRQSDIIEDVRTIDRRISSVEEAITRGTWLRRNWPEALLATVLLLLVTGNLTLAEMKAGVMAWAGS